MTSFMVKWWRMGSGLLRRKGNVSCPRLLTWLKYEESSHFLDLICLDELHQLRSRGRYGVMVVQKSLVVSRELLGTTAIIQTNDSRRSQINERVNDTSTSSTYVRIKTTIDKKKTTIKLNRFITFSFDNDRRQRVGTVGTSDTCCGGTSSIHVNTLPAIM